MPSDSSEEGVLAGVLLLLFLLLLPLLFFVDRIRLLPGGRGIADGQVGRGLRRLPVVVGTGRSILLQSGWRRKRAKLLSPIDRPKEKSPEISLSFRGGHPRNFDTATKKKSGGRGTFASRERWGSEQWNGAISTDRRHPSTRSIHPPARRRAARLRRIVMWARFASRAPSSAPTRPQPADAASQHRFEVGPDPETRPFPAAPGLRPCPGSRARRGHRPNADTPMETRHTCRTAAGARVGAAWPEGTGRTPHLRVQDLRRLGLGHAKPARPCPRVRNAFAHTFKRQGHAGGAERAPGARRGIPRVWHETVRWIDRRGITYPRKKGA